MPHDRFYCPSPFLSHEKVCIHEEEHHHLIRVMRHKVGDVIELVNGQGDLALAKIDAVEKRSSSLEILSTQQTPSPLLPFSLGIASMRSTKIEWIIEKGTEIGVSSFFIFKADFSEKKEFSKAVEKRLFTIRIASMKQSGRLFLPSLEWVDSLSLLLRKSASIYYGDLKAAQHPFPSLSKDLSPLFISGPEKGFSPKEKALLSQKGTPILLSPYTLRAETAPLVAACLLSQHCLEKIS